MLIKGLKKIGDHEIIVVNFTDNTTNIKTEFINQATGIVTILIKIIEVNFGKSTLNNSKWDKIIEG